MYVILYDKTRRYNLSLNFIPSRSFDVFLQKCFRDIESSVYQIFAFPNLQKISVFRLRLSSYHGNDDLLSAAAFSGPGGGGVVTLNLSPRQFFADSSLECEAILLS